MLPAMAVVEYEKQGHVALVTLNRPEARNAISPEVACRLADAWDEAQADDGIRVIVVTSPEMASPGSVPHGATLATKWPTI